VGGLQKDGGFELMHQGHTTIKTKISVNNYFQPKLDQENAQIYIEISGVLTKTNI